MNTEYIALKICVYYIAFKGLLYCSCIVKSSVKQNCHFLHIYTCCAVAIPSEVKPSWMKVEVGGS